MPTKDTLVAWLRYVIEESGLHTRSEWGHIIGVSPQAQGRWLAGKDLPRPETLRRLVVALRDDTSAPGRQAMERWEQLSSRPLAAVCPGTRQDAPTLGHLLVEPLWDNLQRTVRPLAPALQERIVTDAIKSANRHILERDRGLGELAAASCEAATAVLADFANAVRQDGVEPIEQVSRTIRQRQSSWPLFSRELH